jgi:hypothetical protein
MTACAFTAGHAIGVKSDYDTIMWECARQDHSIANRLGQVATLREVECATDVTAPLVRDYFVFVHAPDDQLNESNLVLRYREAGDDADWTVPPTVTWESDSTLEIAMGTPTKSYIYPTLIRNGIGNVAVSYSKACCRSELPGGLRYRSEKGWRLFTR